MRGDSSTGWNDSPGPAFELWIQIVRAIPAGVLTNRLSSHHRDMTGIENECRPGRFITPKACTIDTNSTLLSRSFATPYLVRSVPSPQRRLVLSFPAKSKLSRPCGGRSGAMNPDQ